MNKIYALALGLVTVSSSVYAEESKNVPDPVNVANVRTALTFGINDDGSGKASADISGNYNPTFSYMLKAEGEWNEDQKYSGARFQYYNLANTNFKYIPKTALSYDYFRLEEDNDSLNVDMHAIGSISTIPLGKNSKVTLSPQIAYLQSTFDFKGGAERKPDGIMSVVYLSKGIGKKGSYVMVYPEYYKLKGDGIDYEQKNINFTFGSTLTQDKKWWYIVEFFHKENETSVDGFKVKSNDNVVNFKIRRFFF